ncbi:MAG: RhuM family protein [Ignavibacteriaceae bacterium]|jgi:prophage maintenance system killer protein
MKNDVNNKGEILLYKAEDNSIAIDVKLKEESVWLTQKQMAQLFDKDSDTVGLHIRNIYHEGELENKSTAEYFSVVQLEGKRRITRSIQHYNLDVIISVGYRVNSKRGTQFRIWANRVLKDYLVKGYALNDKRLKEQSQHIKQLERTLEIFKKVAESYPIQKDEFSGILQVVSDYAHALNLLDDYDYQRMKIKATTKQTEFTIEYESAKKIIRKLKQQFSPSRFFGREKDESFKSSLETIYQTFGGKYLYPSVEEKAANLLYFIIKNHSFVDGNKRIAAAIFLWFMNENKLLYRKDGSKRIADNALVALCLLIAESDPKEHSMIVKVLVNLINKNN